VGNLVSIDQAIVLAFVAANFGLPIAYENDDFDPQDSFDPATADAFAELIVAQNYVTPFSLNHSDQSDGVFRVILRAPLRDGAIPIKKKADEIFQAFKIGKRLTQAGVSVTMTGAKREPGVPEDGWFKLVLTMPYKAFLTR